VARAWDPISPVPQWGNLWGLAAHGSFIAWALDTHEGLVSIANTGRALNWLPRPPLDLQDNPYVRTGFWLSLPNMRGPLATVFWRGFAETSYWISEGR
jgi:hypothetical protein